MNAIRHWCAELRYPGLTSFLFGTAHLDSRDGEETARMKIASVALTVIPAGFEIVAMLPGSITFHPEGP